MKLKIELDNPKYCESCPKLVIGHFPSGPMGFTILKEYKHCILKTKFDFGYTIYRDSDGKCIRPKKCIKENGL